MTAQTMFEIAGARLPTGSAATAALIVIDAQEEYRSGRLKLSGLAPALDNIVRLIAHWRDQNGTVIHVQHHGKGLFDPKGPYAAIMAEVAPQGDEPVLTKAVPNAFSGTNLRELIDTAGLDHIVLAGFMTHVCISTTARAAREQGLNVSISDDATATRDLPTTADRATIPATELHRAELAMLADAFAKVVATKDVIAA
tara:strand:+ start:2745 stop:3338 length:594 start_codon:yes stop_codon:yes gene_type:complete